MGCFVSLLLASYYSTREDKIVYGFVAAGFHHFIVVVVCRRHVDAHKFTLSKLGKKYRLAVVRSGEAVKL